MTASRSLTPLGALARGLAAGVAGTAAMTAWQELSARLQSSGDGPGQDEPSDPWESASVPAQVGRRIIEGVFQREAPPSWIGPLTQIMHWGYGTGWGAVYGLVAGSRRLPPLRGGLAFGTVVWTLSYVQLVPMGLYEPPWRYGPSGLALDLSYHLAYGAGVGAGWALTPAPR
jgi:hypothetical protein